jgi:hypothetical protein
MRQTISGVIAAIAVLAVSAAPALACGDSPCLQSYVPAPVYSGCNTGCGGGWGYERLPDPVHQYYYADQGPTYTGPGDFAPYPVYREDALPGWRYYHHHHHYYGYHHPYFHHWHAHHDFYGYPEHHGFHDGYGAHHGYYAPHMSHHYGYGYHEHTLRRYY